MVASRVLLLSPFLLVLGACTTTVHPADPSGVMDRKLSPVERSAQGDDSAKMKNLTVADLVDKGHVHLNKGNASLAKLHFMMALQKDPDSPAAAIGLGRVLYRQGDYEAAQEVFDKAIAEDSPFVAAAQLGMAKIYRERGNLDLAVDHINKALAITPDDAEILTELAFTYDVMGQGQEILAEPLYLKVVALRPGESSSFNNLGYNYLLQGRYAEAITALRRSLELDSGNRMARNNLATAYALNGDDKRALQVFESVLGKAAAYNNLGYIHMTQGQWDKAEKSFMAALDASPRFYVRAQQNLERVRELRKGDHL